MRLGPGGRGQHPGGASRAGAQRGRGVPGILGPSAGSVPRASGLASLLSEPHTLTDETRISSRLRRGAGVGVGEGRESSLGRFLSLPPPPPSHGCPPFLAPDRPTWVTSRLLQFLFSWWFSLPWSSTPPACWVNSDWDWAWAGRIRWGLTGALALTLPPGYSGLQVAAREGSWSGRWCP